MSSSLNIGTTGLAASEKQMDVIGNNLANANTVGFKAADTYFASMLSQSLSGGGGAASVGQGVGVAAVSTVFAQGTFQSTGNATDAAIDGNGFFIVKDKDGNSLYTRAGGFHINSLGVLSDINNYALQGHMFDSNGIIEYQNMSALNLQNAQSKPAETTYFGVGMTLGSETQPGDTFNSSQVVYDSRGAKHNLNTIFTKMGDPNYWAMQTLLDGVSSTSQSYTGLRFDATGNLIKVYNADFTANPTLTAAGHTGTLAAVDPWVINNRGQLYKTTDPAATPAGQGPIILTRGANADTWTISGNGDYPSAVLVLGAAGADDLVGVDLDGIGGADITFNMLSDATHVWGAGDAISFNITQTESDPANSIVRFYVPGGTLPDGSTIGNDGDLTWNLVGIPDHVAPNMKTFATTSRISSLENDGYAPGTLSSLVINKDGIVEGMFSNGQRQDLARILLGDFVNLQGLNKVGSYFIETNDSGPSVNNKPGSGGLGELQSSSLEMSNTDTAKEFIKMITAQRAYQSSAKIIATADQMLQTLMNVKQ
jgi:flagellar hook protein FlgE